MFTVVSVCLKMLYALQSFDHSVTVHTSYCSRNRVLILLTASESPNVRGMLVNMEQVGQNESQIHNELTLAVLLYIAGQPTDVLYKHNVFMFRL